jgi:transposase-like protein
VLNHLRVEHVPHQLFVIHLSRMLLNLLFHGGAMNTPNINLTQLAEQFGTDEKCRKALEQLRWKNGPECPRCSSKATPIANRDQFDCDSCHYQFSVTTGTIFHDSHLSLWKWFITVALLCRAKKGMSACQIQSTVGMSYKTAWYLCHRIRAAMVETEPKTKMGGTVEIDETYVAGKKRRWRPKGQEQVVIGIRERNGNLRLIRAKDAKSKTVKEIIHANVGRHIEVILIDESAIYPWALDHVQKTKHKTINHTCGYAHGDIHTNTVESAFSLLKRGIIGTWHKVSAKHLPAYLDEMCFRFNNRKNPYLFRDTILKLIQTPNLEYKELTAKVEDAA